MTDTPIKRVRKVEMTASSDEQGSESVHEEALLCCCCVVVEVCATKRTHRHTGCMNECGL